jgi:Na+-transporting methylmalonyl-CoA/oxaloacetate decarboxylase gamma subunit
MANLTTNFTNSKKGKFGSTMGVTSIIAILVVLVLVVFAALSYTTSKADYSLAKKTSEVTAAYYAADSKAEEQTAAIIAAAKQTGWQRSFLTRVAPAEGETVPELSVQADGTHVVFTENIDKTQELQIELLVTEDGKVSRLKWQIAPIGDWEPDNSLNVIK